MHAIAGEMSEQVIAADHAQILRLGRPGVVSHRRQEASNASLIDRLAIAEKGGEGCARGLALLEHALLFAAA